jgi:long-subunit fatty acid transport protein
MKLLLGVVGVLAAIPSSARAGGLTLPGSGAVSTSRAGAAIASADDAEAISLNPAGIAKSSGTVVTFGLAAIDYSLAFTRDGTYPAIAEQATTYAGQPFPTMTNQPKPPLGFGSFQPVPVIGIVSDLGNKVPGLHVGFAIYAPNAYPFREFNTVCPIPNPTQTPCGPYFTPPGGGNKGYTLTRFGSGDAPPPTRYDIIHQEAAIVLPSIAVAYHFKKIDLDIGGRFSSGIAALKSTVAIWGNPRNHEEWISSDGLISLDATAVGVTTGALGANYRPTPAIELAAVYNFPTDIHAHGKAYPDNGPAVAIPPVTGSPVVITPAPDDQVRCDKGGTMGELRGCADIRLPDTASIGGRYRFLENGKEKGDIELNLGWEHWGDECNVNDSTCFGASDYRVVVDAQAGIANTPPDQRIPLKDSRISHGYQNTYNVRLGGSWRFPAGANALVARGGVSYDTAAAKPGWERLDVDGAARVMFAAGASYQLPRWRFDLGFGYIFEGTRNQTRHCFVDGNAVNGCGPGGTAQPVADPTKTDGTPNPNRLGPDPTSPIIEPNVQFEHPVNQGTFVSHYVMFMLGAQAKF